MWPSIRENACKNVATNRIKSWLKVSGSPAQVGIFWRACSKTDYLASPAEVSFIRSGSGLKTCIPSNLPGRACRLSWPRTTLRTTEKAQGECQLSWTVVKCVQTEQWKETFLSRIRKKITKHTQIIEDLMPDLPEAKCCDLVFKVKKGQGLVKHFKKLFHLNIYLFGCVES